MQSDELSRLEAAFLQATIGRMDAKEIGDRKAELRYTELQSDILIDLRKIDPVKFGFIEVASDGTRRER